MKPQAKKRWSSFETQTQNQSEHINLYDIYSSGYCSIQYKHQFFKTSFKHFLSTFRTSNQQNVFDYM